MNPTEEVQRLIYSTLTGNAEIMALANGVYDSVPEDPFGAKTAYITFGHEIWRDDGADCIDGQAGELELEIWSRAPGRLECRKLTDLVRDALHETELTLSEHALAETRVEMIEFERDSDGITTLGTVHLTASIEETQS